jgi:hypothetical protein
MTKTPKNASLFVVCVMLTFLADAGNGVHLQIEYYSVMHPTKSSYIGS